MILWDRDVAPVLDCYLVDLSSNNCNLKFMVMWDETTINFLDIGLKGDVTLGKVTTSLFRKPTSGNTILQANSCHAKHTILAISRGELTRAKRACSLEKDYLQESTNIRKRLKCRGKDWMLHSAEAKIKNVTREMLLFQRKDHNTLSDASPLVFFSLQP